MEKYAVIQISGKQFLVGDGDVLEVERQSKSPKADVLMFFDGKKHIIGSPIIKESLIKVTNIEDKKGLKIRVARFKSKSRYRKVKGHRQPLSVVKVDFVSESKTASKKSDSPKKDKVLDKSKKVARASSTKGKKNAPVKPSGGK